MKDNYAEVLESYLIPAEEGLGDFIDNNPGKVMLGLAGLGIGAITFAAVRKIIDNNHKSKLYRPFAAASAIYHIVNNKKYHSIQYDSNILDLLKYGEKAVINSNRYFNELNKAIIDGSERSAVIALESLRKYFISAADTLEDMRSSDIATAVRNSQEITNISRALESYTNKCDQIFTKNTVVYNAFTTKKKVLKTHYNDSTKPSGMINVTKDFSIGVDTETLPPSAVLTEALDAYTKALTNFHNNLIRISIKIKE